VNADAKLLALSLKLPFAKDIYAFIPVSLSSEVSVIEIETIALDTEAELFVSQVTVKSELLNPDKSSENVA
jgi:hypothetical protein